MKELSVLPTPKEKPFLFGKYQYIYAKGLTYEQWLQLVIKAIKEFNFGPDNQYLGVFGGATDKPHLEALRKELQDIGWTVITVNKIGFDSWRIKKRISLYIAHPDDPEL